MKISIIIINKNFGNYIEETLKNILSQDYNNFEVIVIDAASDDNSVDILKKYNDNITWISEPDSGHGEGLLKGVLMASGKIITIQSADDIMYPGTISYVANYFSKINKKISGIYGLTSQIDQNGDDIPTGRTFELMRMQHNNSKFIIGEISTQKDKDLERRNFDYNFIDLLTRKIVLPTNAVFFRKDVFLMCDYEDLKKLSVCPDYRMWLEMGLIAPFVPVNRYFCKNRKQLGGTNINPKNIKVLQDAHKSTMEWFVNNPVVPDKYKSKSVIKKLSLRISMRSVNIWLNISIKEYLKRFTMLLIKNPDIIYYWPNHFKRYIKHIFKLSLRVKRSIL